MPDIQQLSPSVVNKIAAGEVIERPASVVKELMENSLDAGAKRIDVVVEKGGVDAIRIVDNGCGISSDQLLLALSSHATSKIRDADDLFRVSTLGFRGEALASIAAVSRFTLRSRPHEADVGAEIELVGGEPEVNQEQGGVVPVGSPVGTTIEVRNLFFNTPVRRKFLRTTQTEMSHITEAFTRLALAYPEVHFTLRHNQRTVHDLPPDADMVQRIARFFGDDLAQSLIPVESAADGVALAGFVAHPSHSRSNQRWQYLFLNGRYIRDRSLSHALSEAYRGLLLTGRYPVCFLHWKMPPDEVDVNVHPTKQEVRFQESGKLYSQLLSMLRTRFLTSDLKSKGNVVVSPEVDEETLATEGSSELIDWAKGQLSSQKPTDSSGDAPQQLPFGSTSMPSFKRFDDGTGQRSPLVLNRFEAAHHATAETPARSASSSELNANTEGTSASSTTEASGPQPTGPFIRAMQIHNRYLVTETPEGIEVIDQHALHERILYEQLKEKILTGALEAQRLLVPEPVDLAPAEAAIVLENKETLSALGVEVEPFGGETILVSAYPAMLSNLLPAEVLRDLVDRLMVDGKIPEERDLIDELLHMIACKAAVKFGDSLTPEEIDALLTNRHLAQDHHHCPHGRPTALVFTREELDRQFKRI